MKRDMDLIRQILLAIEDSPTGYAPTPLVLPPYSAEEIAFNTLLAVEHGLIDGIDVTSLNGPPAAIPTRLTANGFDFLDAARDQDRWTEARDSIAQKAGAVTLSVLTDLLKRMAMGQLGL